MRARRPLKCRFTMADGSTNYVIRGGVEGRERLRLLSRIMHASTSALFDGLGISGNLRCLDVGCGGGDVTLQLATRVAPAGTVLGIDMDATKIEIARREASGHSNVEFQVVRVGDRPMEAAFDVVYARFLLTHLSDPQGAVHDFARWLRPGGCVILEDIDFTGHFVYPESAAFNRYHHLYSTAARQRGGDPDIGPRLPLLLKRSGLIDIGVSVVQPMGLEGEMKLISAVTMENIADAVTSQGLASAEEIVSITRQLYELANDPDTLAGTPRIVQTWGRGA